MLGRLTLTLGNSSLRLLRARHFRSFAQTRSRRSTWIIFALKPGWTQPGVPFSRWTGARKGHTYTCWKAV